MQPPVFPLYDWKIKLLLLLMATNDRHKTHLIDIDHEDLGLGGRPRTLVVIHLGYAQVLMVGCDYLGQLTHVFVEESTSHINTSQFYSTDTFLKLNLAVDKATTILTQSLQNVDYLTPSDRISCCNGNVTMYTVIVFTQK